MTGDREPRFEGLSGLLDGWDSGDGAPLSFEYQPGLVRLPDLDFVPPPTESVGWSWAMLQEHAADLYERVQAERLRTAQVEREELTRLYWSGPDKIARQILRAYRLSAAQLGLVPKSAFSSEHRRRQRARAKRRRR